VSNVGREAAFAPPATATPAKPRYWLWQPPGVLLYAAVALSVLMALWLSSVRSEVGQWATTVVSLSIAGIWVVRIAGAARERLQSSPVEWIRWLAIPAILGIAGLILWSDAPFGVRLSLSRAGMDQAATEVMAGDTTERQWIGLWAVDGVEKIPGGIRFIVASGDTNERWGFAYSETGGRPAIMDPNDGYEHLDGDWWLWTDGTRG
jgi:hypothetical protein